MLLLIAIYVDVGPVYVLLCLGDFTWTSACKCYGSTFMSNGCIGLNGHGLLDQIAFWIEILVDELVARLIVFLRVEMHVGKSILM